jgi:hypothetical protein
MNFKRNAVRSVGITVVAGIAVFFFGCAKEDISDEFARISAQEVSNMDANASTMLTAPGGIAKLAAAAGDTVYYDWNVVPFHWDSASGDYFLWRQATFTNLSDGYERVRTDTVTFYDHTGNTLRHPTLATVDSIRHVRHVKRDRGGNELEITCDMHSTISLSPDTIHVKNGTITGTYDGDRIRSHGTVTNVTRQFTGGGYWQFPRSGAISVEFPRRSYEVEFTGNGNATLTATNNATGKSRVVTIHVEER